MVVRPANQDGASLAEAPAAAPTSSGPIGGVTGCRKLPNFAKSVGFTEQAALSTSESQEKGLVLIDLADANHRYQHPTWTQLGYLGPITYDSQGNVYVAPTPHVSLIENPPEQQTTIYRADTDTGELAEFLKLEPVTPPTGHPFGVMGLTYDCDTNSLYATTVAGSTRREELGRIVRIDPSTGKVTGELPKTDAIGLAVFNGTTGKRLYFGSARNSEVRSVALDDQGNFSGPVRVEFKIPGWEDKARRISFERRMP